MVRIELIERLRRQIYGGFPTDAATITDGLVNSWISDGLALAAKKNYTDNIQMEGVGFVNNSFFTTFKGLAISKDEQFLYKFILPEIPIGIGSVDGISRVVFKDSKSNISYPAIIINENQVSIQRSMRSIPNKILCYPEGGNCFAITTILMSEFTASVTMVSGGDSTNLNSILNIPGDYIGVIVDYIKSQLAFERAQMPDMANDGVDIK